MNFYNLVLQFCHYIWSQIIWNINTPYHKHFYLQVLFISYAENKWTSSIQFVSSVLLARHPIIYFYSVKLGSMDPKYGKFSFCFAHVIYFLFSGDVFVEFVSLKICFVKCTECTRDRKQIKYCELGNWLGEMKVEVRFF